YSTTIYQVGAARDAHGVDLRPAAIVIKRGKLHQVSRPDQLRQTDFPVSKMVHLPNVLVLPRMVNAHAHLDLSSMPPSPYSGSFEHWLMEVIQNSPKPTQVSSIVKQTWQD